MRVYYCDENDKSIGDRIRLARTDKFPAMKQGDLGESIGLNANRIQQYENGARIPKKELLDKIADVLDVDGEYLSSPSCSSAKALIFFLFDMEGYFDLNLARDAESGRIYFCFGRNMAGEQESGLNVLLNRWYDERQNYLKRLDMAYTPQEKEEISRRYRCWKYDFAKEIDAVMGKREVIKNDSDESFLLR